MSQQMNRILAAVGLAAALLLTVPAPSRAVSFREPSFVAAGLVERVWSWLWSLAPSPAPSRPGQISTPVTRTGTSGTPPPVGTTPPGTDDSGSHIDPDGKP
jgi:hypothetical protein